MPFPEALLTSALLGTDTHPVASDLLTASMVQGLPDEMQLLLSFAVDTLRTQTGYIPLHDPRPIPDIATLNTTTRPCGSTIVRFLKLILSGTHRRSLKECCMAIRDARRHVPPEMIPTLLLLGQNRKYLRPFIYPIIGAQGHWLATEIRNQNWKWILTPLDKTIEEAIGEERLQEKELMEEIGGTPNNLGMWQIQKWSRYQFTLWSDDLFEMLMMRLEQLATPHQSHETWWRDGYLRALTPLSYAFPLARWDEMARRLSKARTFGKYATDILATLEVVYRFRQEMILAASEETL